jgi:hypothetical protein
MPAPRNTPAVTEGFGCIPKSFLTYGRHGHVMKKRRATAAMLRYRGSSRSQNGWRRIPSQQSALSPPVRALLAVADESARVDLIAIHRTTEELQEIARMAG